ncbi:hypothetical protein [Rudanella lutea]|uniref:hypothetical protein n=1 Tax=Rudanella lutea TaxID=451374 RepID=UPI000378F570|nr:hypothetical protein [Rudanella lutea]
MAKRTFELCYEWWYATLIIDDELAANELKEVVEYRDDWESVLATHNGDYAKAFCHYIGPELVIESPNSTLEWVRDYVFTKKEGYCMKLDGTKGIELTAIDEWYLERELVEVREL